MTASGFPTAFSGFSWIDGQGGVIEPNEDWFLGPMEGETHAAYGSVERREPTA
jgi:hypothetical protein